MPEYSSCHPDELLVRARQQGEVGPLVDVYRGYLKTLARVQLGGRLPQKLDASDVVQEVLLRVHRRFQQFQGTTEQEFLAWLRKVLASVISNLLRQFYGTRRRAVTVERVIGRQLDEASHVLNRALLDSEPSPSEQLVRKERAVLLADALERLPEDYRDVILLRHVEQLTFPEIAARMKRSVDSVKKLWPRALARLRQLTKELS
jgi:RNA polymerase sigma-70 factor (ECF subfamily)